MAFAFGTADSAFSARLVTLPSVHKSTALAGKLEQLWHFAEQFKLRTGMLIEMPAEIWTRSEKASPRRPNFRVLMKKKVLREPNAPISTLVFSSLACPADPNGPGNGVRGKSRYFHISLARRGYDDRAINQPAAPHSSKQEKSRIISRRGLLSSRRSAGSQKQSICLESC